MGKSVVKDKSFDFAVRIVKLCRYLREEKKEFVLSGSVFGIMSVPFCVKVSSTIKAFSDKSACNITGAVSTAKGYSSGKIFENPSFV